ncbi:MAG: hypothetical protein ACOYM3_11030, partial [Terrimicrobiaceae bacterium]
AVTWDDGQTQTLGQMERASVFFANGQPRCLFAAVGDGPGGFENMTRSWNVAIPLHGGRPVIAIAPAANRGKGAEMAARWVGCLKEQGSTDKLLLEIRGRK